MNVWMKWLATAVVTVSLLFSCRDAAAADAPATGAAAAADPADWGVYAQLPGTEWSGHDGNVTWLWGPDGAIVESRTFQMKSVIRPGANRGELVSVYGGGLHTYDGRIAADGSVLWIRRGRFLKMPSRVSIVEGRFVEEMVKLDEASQVAKVNSVHRFEQTAGPTLLAAVASVSGELVTHDAVQQSKQSDPAPAPTLPAEVVPAAIVTLDDPAEPAVGLENPASLPPSRALFGPYAELVGRAHITPDGYQIRWFQSSDTAIVHEIRGPDGSLTLLQIIKTTSPGSLVMLRSAGCPDGVCGQTGVVVDGRAHWKEPKASGGFSGGYMDTKVWVEDGQYVSHMTDPAPAGGSAFFDQYPHLRPVPQRLSLVQSPALTPAQMEERRTQVSQMEPMVEVEVAKAIGKQLATGQSIADAQAARQRSADRVRSFNRTMQGIGGVLNDAVAEVGTYDEAQANLDATVANIQYAADVERQQQALAAQQAQTRAAEEQRQQLAANARWVAEKEQAAAEYRSGQVDAEAARETQLVEQQRAEQQRRASAAVESRSAEQVATVKRQQAQSAALAERNPIAAKPVAVTQRPETEVSTDKTPGQSGSTQLYVFFILLGNQTVAFEGPLALTLAESVAMEARLRGEAPSKYGAGATVDRRWRGPGTCLFVYQIPGEALYKLGSGNGSVDTERSKNGQISNGKATIHRDVVCPRNN